MKTIILAAGAGSRMKTAEPKPLAHFCFERMIDFVIAAAREAAQELASAEGAEGVDGEGGAGASALSATPVTPLSGGANRGRPESAEGAQPPGGEMAVTGKISSTGAGGGAGGDLSPVSATPVDDEITVVAGHKAEQLEEYLQQRYGAELAAGRLKIARQDMGKKGSAAALFGLEFAAEADYIVLSCDMPLITPALIARLAQTRADVALAAFEAAEAGAYGRVICSADGEFQKIVEAKDATAAELACRLCNGGVYKIRGAVLAQNLAQISAANASAEYYLTDICALALAAGRSVQIVRASEAELAGVNDLAQLADAEAAMFERIARRWRLEGHYVAKGAQIGARARLANGCRIAAGVAIKGACELDAAEVLEHSVIESSAVANSTVGPLARLRPGCEVRGSRVGNFVECKAAQITGAKAGHHAYLGDCEVGEGANIGCGVIVCNYDGARKHRTSIGAGSFVGSNVCVIAPAALPEGCYIAAGSTITGRDAAELAPGERFIARSRGGRF